MPLAALYCFQLMKQHSLVDLKFILTERTFTIGLILCIYIVFVYSPCSTHRWRIVVSCWTMLGVSSLPKMLDMLSSSKYWARPSHPSLTMLDLLFRSEILGTFNKIISLLETMTERKREKIQYSPENKFCSN